ncbi:hypothetical protein CLOP_g22901, partial [Closterium sp. NIES-67]
LVMSATSRCMFQPSVLGGEPDVWCGNDTRTAHGLPGFKSRREQFLNSLSSGNFDATQLHFPKCSRCW